MHAEPIHVLDHAFRGHHLLKAQKDKAAVRDGRDLSQRREEDTAPNTSRTKKWT